MTSANLLEKNSATSFFQSASGGLSLIRPQRLPGELHEDILQVRAPHREVRDVSARPYQRPDHVCDDARTILAVHDQVPPLWRDPLDPGHPADGGVLHRVAERRHDALDAP